MIRSILPFLLLVAACSSPEAPSVTSRSALDTPSAGILASVTPTKRRVAAVARFDGDSIANIGVGYDVSQHLYFVVKDTAGDSVGFSPVKTIVSIPTVPSAGPCEIPRYGLTLYCPVTDGAYFLITTQGDGVSGIPDSELEGAIHLYVSSNGSPLSFNGRFHGDSIVREGKAYDVAKHFDFAVVNQAGDSVTFVPVVNVPSIQWTLVSGVTPASPPSCSVAADVLVLNCPSSSGAGFEGYYSVSVQQLSFNGIANPSYRGSFHLYVKSGRKNP